MSGNYQPPKKRTPIALRLVSRITGYTVKRLVSILTEPPPHGSHDIIYLNAYQWPDKQKVKPVAALRLLLATAMAAETDRNAIAAIPTELFVWSDELENSMIDLYLDIQGEPPPFSERLDWSPYISDIEDLVRQCFPSLRTICPITKHKSREQGKKETKARNDLLQNKCNGILNNEPGLSKQEVAKRLKRIPEFSNMELGRIMRIIRTRDNNSKT